MGIRYRRMYVHGAPVTVTQCCPQDGLTDLRFPAYLDLYNPSGIVHPYGSIGDDKLKHPYGIVPPTGGVNPSGYNRPSPSGLQRGPFSRANYTGAEDNGKDTYTHYLDENWRQAYWTCPSGHFFIFPSGRAQDMPDDANLGNISHPIPVPFGNFE